MRAAMYASFDRFLQEAIKEYYDRFGRRQRGDFVALLIASGEVAPLAVDRIRRATPGELAGAAAAAVALRLGLRFALSGPLAVLVGGLTLASMTAYLFRRQGEVMSRVEPFRQAIAAVRAEYERIQEGHAAGRYADADRTLMIDGLTRRLVEDLERAAAAARASAAADRQADPAPGREEDAP